MKVLLIHLVLLFVTVFNTFSQSTPVSKRYFIQFRDRAESPYSITEPAQFLSPKALERRIKQGIEIVENDLPVNPNYVAQVAAITGVEVVNRSKWFNAITIQTTDSLAAEAVRNLPFVLQSQQTGRRKKPTNSDYFLNDFSKLKAEAQAKDAAKLEKLDEGNYYGKGQKQITMLAGQKLHALGFQGQGITIAVLDAGFYRVNELPYFEKLRNEGRLLGTRDFVDGGNSVFEDNSHGLSVLSTMASYKVGDYVGTAPAASYWLLRSENAATEFINEEDNWARAAEFADSVGADIINSSLGYTVFDNVATSHNYSQLDGKTTRITIAADIAASKGMLIVNSAGNSGDDAWRHIGAPADGDSVLTIGATDSLGAYASFSSIGPSADGRIKPNVTAMGERAQIVSSGGTVAPSNGTSFSAPIVCGLAACLWQAHPESSAMQIFKAIEQSASQYENPDIEKGFGIPNFLRAHEILAQSKLKGTEADSIINVYPNPFIEGVTLEFYSTVEQNIKVSIFKLNGKRVEEEIHVVYPHANNTIHLDHVKKLSAGVYNITIQTPQKTFNRKVIKN
jgi:subtilisin family serine protease